MGQQINDGGAWTVGGQAEVEWIAEDTGSGPQITTATPPRYAAYATLTNAGAANMRRHSGKTAWWLGYRDTGASDIVFWDVPKVTIYWEWKYALVLAGPDQAANWRPAPGGEPNWKSTELPELMFPEDRSWVVSFLWDDDWACIGGSDDLRR
jgi:hypothetical protein